jgi:hypothetical protein
VGRPQLTVRRRRRGGNEISSTPTQEHRASYATPGPSADPKRPGVGGRKVIEAAKREVTTLRLAEKELGPGVPRGLEVFFGCPFHEDRSPSLRVNGEKDLWICDPCGVGGDVVRLAELLWRHERADVAAAELLMLFGHEVPRRPSSWFRKQERQRPIRSEVERIAVASLRRRLFRILAPMVAEIADEEERAREERYIWEDLTPLAVRMVKERAG